LNRQYNTVIESSDDSVQDGIDPGELSKLLGVLGPHQSLLRQLVLLENGLDVDAIHHGDTASGHY
jgi:hypothetical protein